MTKKPMVHIDRLQKHAKTIADKTLLLFDPVTMNRAEKAMFKLARKKVIAKIETLCFENRIDFLLELIQYVEANLYDMKRAANIIKSMEIPQRTRDSNGVFLG